MNFATTFQSTLGNKNKFDGIGVEKTFPIYLPSIESVKIVKKTRVRRAKLYYLRDKTSKEIRKKLRTEQTQTVKTSVEKEASQ